MNACFRIGLAGILLMAVTGSGALAQNLSGGTNIFEPLKTQMLVLTKENSALVQKNKELKMQLVKLQLEAKKREAELNETEPEPVAVQETAQEGEMAMSLSAPSRVNNDLLTREVQDIYRSGQSLDLTPEQRLLELRLYDLQLEKQQLLLDFAEKEVAYRGIGMERRKELDVYQNQVEGHQKTMNKLTREIAETEKKAANYPQEIQLLKMENNELRYKIAQMQKILSEGKK